MSAQELDSAILRLLLASPTQSEIANKLNASGSAVTKSLARLTAAGFIDLQRDKQDGRIQRPRLKLFAAVDALESAVTALREAAS